MAITMVFIESFFFFFVALLLLMVLSLKVRNYYDAWQPHYSLRVCYKENDMRLESKDKQVQVS